MAAESSGGSHEAVAQSPPRYGNVPHTRAAWIAAAALGGLLGAGVGCTGNILPSSPGQGSPGAAGGPGGPGSAGAQGQGGQGQSQGQGGTGQGTVGPGTAGQGGDPYAVPSSPPATTLVPTPRVARLSRQQWSNTVRDLLKLTDISDIDANVTGDALIGFDNEADALFVTEQLRKQLADAAEKLADKVTADATALARLVPANAPTDAAGKAKAFITSFGQRAFRRPLTDAEVIHARCALQPGLDALSGRRHVQVRHEPGDSGDAAIAAFPLSHGAWNGHRPAPRRSRSTTGRLPPSSRSRSPTPCPTTRCSPPPPPNSSTTRPV